MKEVTVEISADEKIKVSAHQPVKEGDANTMFVTISQVWQGDIVESVLLPFGILDKLILALRHVAEEEQKEE